ncbi:MAG TPA: metallophosphoesterase [Pyrinomonadaceae bacterium]|nr:metallophosphoesterase [Pyrinomonadaceae bacterium]
MSTTGKHLRFSFLLAGIALIALIVTPAPSALTVTTQETTPPNFKIAFIGDQYLGANPDAVMSLIKAEGAAAVIISGDLDYTDNPAAWEAQINSVLGANFPVFVAIGNHDVAAWGGPTGYQQYLKDRFNRLGISWSGDLGVQSSFHYKGLFFVMTAPGIEGGYDNGNNDTYIRDHLAADTSAWSICSWHKNQTLMQVGGKPDETGWGVYEEARKGGAIIATAHEHSYSRTHLMNSMVNHTVANGANSFALNKGNTFAFVSGLGGNGVRPQLLGGNWWASIYTSTCLPADPVCKPNGNFGALFGTFNVDGQANKAVFYFKDVAGNTIDSFTVFSNVELPILNTLSPAGAQPGAPALPLTLNGENFVPSSIVRWNGADRVTTFISSSQLTAAIPAADLTAAATALVTVFNPTGVGATSTVRTFSVGPAAPRLLNEANSERALAMDSVTKAGGPFALLGNNFSPDQRRRLMLFAANLELLPGENISAVTAQAEDAQHNIYPLTVEFVGKIPQYDWLTQIVVKLPDQLGSSSDVWVSVSLRGATSNKALIGILH